MNRIWTWPRDTTTGCYRTEPHRPLDSPEGPTGVEWVRADDVRTFLQELIDHKPTVISGRDPRDRSGQSDVDDMTPLDEFEAWQADAKVLLKRLTAPDTASLAPAAPLTDHLTQVEAELTGGSPI